MYIAPGIGVTRPTTLPALQLAAAIVLVAGAARAQSQASFDKGPWPAELAPQRRPDRTHAAPQEPDCCSPTAAYHRAPRPWLFRFHTGLGFPNSSAARRMLREDGFRMDYRPELMMDLSHTVGSSAYLGVFTGVAGLSTTGYFENTDTLAHKPKLEQVVAVYGAQVRWVAVKQPMLSIGPRVGVAHGQLGLGSGAQWHTTFLLGAEASLVALRAGPSNGEFQLGVALGAYWAPSKTPGLYPMSYDMGSVSLSVFGGFGG